MSVQETPLKCSKSLIKIQPRHVDPFDTGREPPGKPAPVGVPLEEVPRFSFRVFEFFVDMARLCRERLLLWFYLAELTQREILSIFRGNKGVRGCDPPYIICTSNNKRSYTFELYNT